MQAYWDYVNDLPDLSGKTAVVTGANSGLGYWTTLGLASRGAQVIMACRNRTKADQAMATLKELYPSANLRFEALDLSNLGSIQTCATALQANHDSLDFLINNAGVMAPPLQRTADGFEMQIGTNHLGHFALTAQLFDLLKASKGARIVNVASMAHRWTKDMDLDDLNWENKRYKKWDAYGKSKLANLLFTFELQRRLSSSSSDVITAAAHPGYSDTNLQFSGPVMENPLVNKALMKVGNSLFAQPAEMGALPTLHAACCPGVSGGDYYGPDGFQQLKGLPKKVGCKASARNEATAAKLWALSEQLTGTAFAIH